MARVSGSYSGVPRWVMILAAVGAAFVLLPLVAMVLRVNWAEFVPLITSESSVTDVLGKVTSGEADAGLVYVTDVAAAGAAVEGIGFAESAGAVTTYPIVPVTGSASADVARAFVDFVTGSAGAQVLRAAGFGAP